MDRGAMRIAQAGARARKKQMNDWVLRIGREQFGFAQAPTAFSEHSTRSA